MFASLLIGFSFGGLVGIAIEKQRQKDLQVVCKYDYVLDLKKCIATEK